MSDASRAQLYYVEEAAWGTTPASALKALRMTGESLKQATDTTVSNEIRSDRQVPDVVRVGARAEGDVNFELSYGTFDELLEGALMSDWVPDGVEVGTDLLENGTTPKSYTLERYLADVAEYQSFKGMRVATLGLTFRPGSILTGKFGFQGKIGDAGAATVGTGAPVAATTTDVMNAVDNIGAITEGGGAAANILGIDLTLTNNLRAQPALGSLSGIGIGLGRCVVTGTLEAYFATRALYEKYLDFVASSLSFAVTDAAGNAYGFTLPRLKYTDGVVVAGGNDQDIVARLPFQAIRDSSSDATFQISRTPAV